MDDLKMYTLDEVAETLKVGQRSLYNYIKAGQLKAVKIGKQWRVSHEALKDFTINGTKGQN
jgi:excisionase family DNA binding protein